MAVKRELDKLYKIRYLKTEKGKAKKREIDASYRKKVDWNEYMKEYRQAGKDRMEEKEIGL